MSPKLITRGRNLLEGCSKPTKSTRRAPATMRRSPPCTRLSAPPSSNCSASMREPWSTCEQLALADRSWRSQAHPPPSPPHPLSLLPPPPPPLSLLPSPLPGSGVDWRVGWARAASQNCNTTPRSRTERPRTLQVCAASVTNWSSRCQEPIPQCSFWIPRPQRKLFCTPHAAIC